MKQSVCLILLLGVVSSAQMYSQGARFKVAIIMESNTRRDTAYFGVNGDGGGGTIEDNTYGIDDNAVFGPYGQYRETLAPPDPPSVTLRSRIVNIPGRPVGRSDMRPWDFRGFTNSAQIDTFAFRVYGDTVADNGAILRWQSNLSQFGSQWILSTRPSGSSTTLTQVANMLSVPSYTLAPTSNQHFVIIKAGATTSVRQQDNRVPDRYQLAQNFPNPFNPSSEIRFSIPEAGHVSLIVYNLLGERVRTLVNETQSAGTYAVTFDATDLPSGMYFYRLSIRSFSEVRKMMLLK